MIEYFLTSIVTQEVLRERVHTSISMRIILHENPFYRTISRRRFLQYLCVTIFARVHFFGHFYTSNLHKCFNMSFVIRERLHKGFYTSIVTRIVYTNIVILVFLRDHFYTSIYTSISTLVLSHD